MRAQKLGRHLVTRIADQVETIKEQFTELG